MAKRQTRRTISISGSLYDHAMDRAEALRVPLSALTEHALRLVLDDETLTADAVAVASVQRRLEAMKRAVERIQPPRRRGRPRNPESASQQAADLYLNTGCLLKTAADRFGITPQAVQKALTARTRGMP